MHKLLGTSTQDATNIVDKFYFCALAWQGNPMLMCSRLLRISITKKPCIDANVHSADYGMLKLVPVITHNKLNAP